MRRKYMAVVIFMVSNTNQETLLHGLTCCNIGICISVGGKCRLEMEKEFIFGDTLGVVSLFLRKNLIISIRCL
jgi:hypothetical protein